MKNYLLLAALTPIALMATAAEKGDKAKPKNNEKKLPNVIGENLV